MGVAQEKESLFVQGAFHDKPEFMVRAIVLKIENIQYTT